MRRKFILYMASVAALSAGCANAETVYFYDANGRDVEKNDRLFQLLMIGKNIIVSGKKIMEKAIKTHRFFVSKTATFKRTFKSSIFFEAVQIFLFIKIKRMHYLLPLKSLLHLNVRFCHNRNQQ